MGLPMNVTRLALFTVVGLATISAVPATAAAQGRRAGVVRVAPRAAVVRVAPRRVIAPRPVIVPYRPYYYPYRPGLSVGVYSGYPYAYPYAYPAYGYGYPGYAYPAYSGYGYGAAYGGVRIQGAPRNGQVFVDGYYVGVVNDFDGVFQRLDLPTGVHRLEIKAPGFPDVAVDVQIVPGRTITYHADGRP
jgi:hypothetical protein